MITTPGLYLAPVSRNENTTVRAHPPASVPGMRTVSGMPDSTVIAAVHEVLRRSHSVCLGVFACTSFPLAQALVEIELVLLASLQDCIADMTNLSASSSVLNNDACMLLTAEQYWLEALLDMVRSRTTINNDSLVLEQVLQALPV